MAQQRRKRGRFDAAYTDRELYTVVRDVATATRPEKPELLAQREFDAAKEGCGYGDAPTARGICARLLVPNGRPTPWRKVVEHSLRGDLETGDASLPSGVERTIPAYKRSRATAGSGSMPSIDKIQTHCGTFTKATAEVRRRRRA